MPKPRPPLDPDCLAFCSRWATVWFALAAASRLAGRWDWAERMTGAGEDVFEALEVIHCDEHRAHRAGCAQCREATQA